MMFTKLKRLFLSGLVAVSAAYSSTAMALDVCSLQPTLDAKVFCYEQAINTIKEEISDLNTDYDKIKDDLICPLFIPEPSSCTQGYTDAKVRSEWVCGESKIKPCDYSWLLFCKGLQLEAAEKALGNLPIIGLPPLPPIGTTLPLDYNDGSAIYRPVFCQHERDLNDRSACLRAKAREVKELMVETQNDSGDGYTFQEICLSVLPGKKTCELFESNTLAEINSRCGPTYKFNCLTYKLDAIKLEYRTVQARLSSQ